MGRRTKTSATSFLLVLMFVLQAACYTALGPPMPVRPWDAEQLQTLREADRVEVERIDGRKQRLTNVNLADGRVHGRIDSSRPRSIPLDSIRTVQPYNEDTAGAVSIVTASVVFLGLVAWSIVDGFEYSL